MLDKTGIKETQQARYQRYRLSEKLGYLNSTYGKRKLIIDFIQNVVVTGEDCGTLGGITKSAVYRGEKVGVPLSKVIAGRVARGNIVDLVKDEVIVKENELIDEDKAKRIETLGYEKIRVRSPLTCEMSLGVCAKCYGMDLTRGKQPEVGDSITIGNPLSKIVNEITCSINTIGGLRRVTEIFEAKKPENPAIISEINGVATIGERKGDKRTVIVKDVFSEFQRKYLVPKNRYLKVHSGHRVRVGDPLVEGPLVLQDILRICGEEELQQYMLKEIQNVYRSQKMHVDDRHIEILIAQMLCKVTVIDPGDTDLLLGQVIEKFRFREENERIRETKGKPATAKPMLINIKNALLQSESTKVIDTKVLKLIKKHHPLLSILCEAPQHIFSIFGRDVELSLELHKEPEDSYDELFVVIRTKRTDAVELLVKLDKWFIPFVKDVDNKLNFTVENL